MKEDYEVKRRLKRRLAPLYVAAFFQSFVLWYTIEKLFMRKIGFDNTEIGFMVALYSAVMLLVETPSGILADRWSRKGVLILASVFLSISSLVGGLSHGIGVYLFAAIFWGIFFACYSGLYDSIIYDTIAEEAEDGKLFDFFYGRSQFADSLGLILGGLSGGLLASAISLRATYFLTIPLGALAIIALVKFREPTLHKKQVALPINVQIRDVFRAILKNHALLPVIVVLILRATISYILYEFSQLWLIALHTPVKYYGLATAILFLSLGISGVMINRLKLVQHVPMILNLVLTLAGCVGLVLFRNTAAIVICQFIVSNGLIVASIIFSRLLHDGLSASIRAGASSAANTIGRFFIIPLALLFGYVSQKFSIYRAGYILLILTIIMGAFVINVSNRNNRTGLESE